MVAEYGGRALSARDVRAIQRLIDDHPWHTREQIARLVCGDFDWRRPNGRWAVSSCRSLLQRLERQGALRLPALRRAGNFFERRRRVTPADLATPAVPKRLSGALVVRPLASEAGRARWHQDMARDHYLGDLTLIGESLYYTAFVGTEAVAHLGWASAALRNAPRDCYLGWDLATRRRGLSRVVNNVRFLILPGVERKNLASRILAANLRRLCADWRAVHGHEVWLAETFVDPARFRGTCYRAANWIEVGRTRGYSRRGPTYQPNERPKRVFVYPLCRRARERLCRGEVEHAHGPSPGATGQEEERMARGVGVDVERLPLEGEGGLIELLDGLVDVRKARGKRHSLKSILALAVVGVVCGMRSLAAIAQFARELPEPIRRRLGGRPLRPPSEPTFRRALKRLDVLDFDRRLGAWMVKHHSLFGQAIALDGKTVCGSKDGDTAAVHLLSALLHQAGVVVAQQRVSDKTNEITHVAPILEPLELRDAVVTADALLTQRSIASYVVEQKQAHYLFAVKDNQPTLRQDIQHLGHGAFSPGAAPRRNLR
ncbi:MAG: ISAs1 family transposase [Gammaproteobacteria bacterium]